MKIKSIILFIAILCVGCSQKQEEQAQLPSFKGESPYLYTDLDGNTYMLWTEANEEENKLLLSTLSKNTWTEPQLIAQGKDWFVNWADYPVMATKQGVNFIAHYLTKSSEGTYSYDVTVKQSTDSGTNWTSPYILHDDGKSAEHGFVSMVPYGDNFFLAWLDGRNTVTDSAMSHDGHGGGGPMTLRAAIITPAGEKLNEWELDNRVCDCCQTTAAITENGPIVAYRDRSEEEIRDMSITRLVGDEWTAPVSLYDDGWKIAGCPVNGPRMSAIGNNVAVGWFSAAEGNTEVKIQFSQDGGETFGEPVKVSKDAPIGRVDVEMLDKQTAIISWMEGAEIVAAKVNANGEILEELTIASSSQSRSSGFPQLTKNNDQLIFAWTDSELGEIKTKIVNLK